MAETSEVQTTITAQCLCKANTFTTTVPTSSLPLDAVACHCNSCRHVTGALYSDDVQWPGAYDELDVSGLRCYKHFPKINVLFCPTCSSTMFFQEHADRSYGVFTGVLPNLPNLIRFSKHIFVGDTGDGGSSVCMRNPNPDGSEAKRNEARDGQVPPDAPSASELPAYGTVSGPDELPIRCRCKGIDFVVKRWDTAYADTPRDKLPWYVDPDTHKYYASFDSCNSCRLSFGVEIVNFTFAPLSLISYAEDGGAPFPSNKAELEAAVEGKKDSRLGTLAFYRSSPDVSRFFCSCCGACVFYSVDERPDVVDISIGLLESPEGARAEGFLSWDFGTMSWADDMNGGWREGLKDSVLKESEAWRIERGYPKTWRRLQKEEAKAKAEGNTKTTE